MNIPTGGRGGTSGKQLILGNWMYLYIYIYIYQSAWVNLYNLGVFLIIDYRLSAPTIGQQDATPTCWESHAPIGPVAYSSSYIIVLVFNWLLQLHNI